MEPLISIVVPCFNYGHYLSECLESILNQTYPVHEIIVVDDESTDNTREVASKYPVKYVWQKNKGLSGSRNTGIKIASGSHIQCIDSDDKMVPGSTEEHVKLLTDDMTIAQCGLMEFGDRHVINVPAKTSLEKMLKSNTVYCNAMFPRKAWVDTGGFDESEIMRLGLEDWEFWIRCLALGYHINSSDFIALRYRVHEGQMTQATTHPKWDKITAYMTEKHRDLYEKYNLI